MIDILLEGTGQTSSHRNCPVWSPCQGFGIFLASVHLNTFQEVALYFHSRLGTPGTKNTISIPAGTLLS